MVNGGMIQFYALSTGRESVNDELRPVVILAQAGIPLQLEVQNPAKRGPRPSPG